MNKVSNDKSVISKKKNYSTLNNFVSGGLALASSFTLMHPLDTARVHLQHSNTNTLQLNNFRKMFRFYSRGFMPSVLLSMPQGGIRLSTYEESKKTSRIYSRPDRYGKMEPYYEYRDTAMSRLSLFKPEWI